MILCLFLTNELMNFIENVQKIVDSLIKHKVNQIQDGPTSSSSEIPLCIISGFTFALSFLVG